MRLLALDTAQQACSAAVWSEGTVVERLEAMRRGHAEALLPMLVEVIHRAGIAFADLDALAVTSGPGAFTGIRIGLAAARGLALATGRPCLGISTLAAVAEGARRAEEREGCGRMERPRLLVVALDTQRGDLYVQSFRGEAPADSPRVAAIDALAQALVGEPVLIAGDAADVLCEAVSRAGGDARPAAGPPYPTAAAVARLAVRSWQAGVRPEAAPEPLYLRPPAVHGGADDRCR